MPAIHEKIHAKLVGKSRTIKRASKPVDQPTVSCQQVKDNKPPQAKIELSPVPLLSQVAVTVSPILNAPPVPVPPERLILGAVTTGAMSSTETAPPEVRRDLFEAMKQVALTGKGPEGQIPSMGCSIKWREHD